MFNLTDYNNSKSEVLQILKIKYAKKGFTIDGIFCPLKYSQIPYKVLVILGEGYMQGTNIYDFVDQMKDDFMGIINHKVQTPRKIAALSWLFYSLIEPKCDTEKIKEQFSSLLKTKGNIQEENYQRLQNGLSNIAWINVKKISNNNSTEMSYSEIFDLCNEIDNREILEKQIDSIKPNLTIVCSNAVINGLERAGLLGTGIDKNKKAEIQQNKEGQKFMLSSHPRYFKHWGYSRISYMACKMLMDYNKLIDNSTEEG